MSSSASPPPAEPHGLRVLAIDTASRTEALALACGDWIVSTLTQRTRRGHSAILLPAIELHLRQQGWRVDDLDGIGVVVGPGSFTGVRVGIATVLGLCRAAGIPAFGYGSLEVRAMSLRHAGPPVAPILDARKGEVYGAAYHGGREILTSCTTTPASFAAELGRAIPEGPILVCGGGARLYRDLLAEHVGDRLHLASGAGDAPGIAEMAVDIVRRLEAGERPSPDALQPEYQRPSQAEQRGS